MNSCRRSPRRTGPGRGEPVDRLQGLDTSLMSTPAAVASLCAPSGTRPVWVSGGSRYPGYPTEAATGPGGGPDGCVKRSPRAGQRAPTLRAEASQAPVAVGRAYHPAVSATAHPSGVARGESTAWSTTDHGHRRVGHVLGGLDEPSGLRCRRDRRAIARAHNRTTHRPRSSTPTHHDQSAPGEAMTEIPLRHHRAPPRDPRRNHSG